MIIWLLFLFCASPIALAIIEGKDFKSKDKKIRNKAWVIFGVIIFMQALQFSTSYIQESENHNINDSLGRLNTNNYLIGEKMNNLLITHENDSSSLAAIKKSLDSSKGSLDSTILLIKESNLIYKNGKLIPKVINSQFYLPNAKFNAPVQQGNGNTQDN